MNDWWVRALAEQVLRYLDQVDRLAEQDAGPRAVELRRLAGAWRALLRVHAPTRRRQCAECGRGCWRHRRREPVCTVWWIANAYFVRRLWLSTERSAQRTHGREGPRP